MRIRNVVITHPSYKSIHGCTRICVLSGICLERLLYCFAFAGAYVYALSIRCCTRYHPGLESGR